jgi:hypothetical protein
MHISCLYYLIIGPKLLNLIGLKVAEDFRVPCQGTGLFSVENATSHLREVSLRAKIVSTLWHSVCHILQVMGYQWVTSGNIFSR